MKNELHLSPADPFPSDLSSVTDQKLQVLDSRVQRQMDREVIREGEAAPETEFRHYELDDEFEIRESR